MLTSVVHRCDGSGTKEIGSRKHGAGKNLKLRDFVPAMTAFRDLPVEVRILSI